MIWSRAGARDSYTALADATEQAILDNVSKAMRINIRKAERRYEDEMQRIRDDGLIGGERTQAIEAADAALARARARLGWGARARMISLRQQFESNRLEGPYFPLSRFGEFFATVRDANGVVTNFSRFESVKDRDRMAAIERRKPGQTVEVGVVSDANLRDMVDPTFVAEVEAILGDAGVSDDIMDEVWQKWLATLPEMSVRKNRIHRKGTAGFDKDAFRSFGNHLFHGAHQLARVTFTMDMTDALEEAKREAARRPDATRQGLIVKEMERRHEYTMNPKGAWWSQVLTQAAFVWYLALTPAAAIVNLTQTTIVGIPVMSTLNPGKGGMGQASRQLNRALLDFTRGRGKIMQSNRLTEDEKAAMKEAYDRGTIDKSQAHDLAAVAESGTEYSPVRTKVMGVISYFFHHTERMSREITFLASYRMAKANGAAPAEAIEKAADITWKTHFDYQNTSRPRIMQGDVARVALTFRNFQVNLLWRLFRDTHQAINGESAKERTEARKQLAGITGMMMLHAGLSGTWLFGLSMTILGLFMDDADDPEEEVKRLITETLGADVGGALFYGIPGYMSGIDLTARIGMPDLWFRSPDRAVEGEEAYNHWLKQVVGAVPSIAESFFRGGAKISDGEYQRGAEMMVPKAVRDILKTYRYATEGVVTAKGDPLIDTLPSYGLIVQALGFTPAEIAERFDVNSRLYERQEQILDARSKVLADAAKIVGAGKPLTDEVLAQINAFNAENPDYPITGDSIVRSVRARQQARDRSEFGATLNPRLNDRLRAERAPMVFAGG